MSGRYFDQPSSSSARSNSASGGSYTDRFRVDDDFPSDFSAPTASASSGSVALGETSTSTRRSRKQIPAPTLLVSLIERACNPTRHEPDLGLNLEVADIVNQKKGTCPRVAATTIVKLVNNKDSHVAILALGVLDICVKNCGYPFHLQISRKEFLNELVRRFPEKPPIAYTRVQSLILQNIQEWWETICCTSKYKDDLGYIRDMHRLLSRKGYMFPEVSAVEAAVLNPSESLRSAAELEQEERDAQEAKLQELIRRGTPADLQEANRLMKVMAGFQGDKKGDYRAKVAEEVDKIRRKSELLDEMLSNTTPGEELPDDDVFSDIVSSLKTSAPKLKSLAQEESDDEEAVAKLLALNDYINSLLEKYKHLKGNDVQKANDVQIVRPSDVQITKGSNSLPAKSISLIDFDDEPSSEAQPAATEHGSLDILSELGGLSLGGGSASSPKTSKSSTQDILAAFGSSPNSLSQSSFQPQGSLFLGSSPSAVTPNATGNSSNALDYDILRSLSSPKPSTPSNGASLLSSPALGSPSLLSSPSGGDRNTHLQTSTGSDEWNFASASSTSTQSSPASSFTLSDDGVLTVAGTVSRDASNNVHIALTFSNKSQSSYLTNLNIQLAVKKGLQIKVEGLSNMTLNPLAINGVSQHSYVEGVPQGSEVKLRWIVSYHINGQQTHKDGVSNLPAV